MERHLVFIHHGMGGRLGTLDDLVTALEGRGLTPIVLRSNHTTLRFLQRDGIVNDGFRAMDEMRATLSRDPPLDTDKLSFLGISFGGLILRAAILTWLQEYPTDSAIFARFEVFLAVATPNIRINPGWFVRGLVAALYGVSGAELLGTRPTIDKLNTAFGGQLSIRSSNTFFKRCILVGIADGDWRVPIWSSLALSDSPSEWSNAAGWIRRHRKGVAADEPIFLPGLHVTPYEDFRDNRWERYIVLCPSAWFDVHAAVHRGRSAEYLATILVEHILQ